MLVFTLDPKSSSPAYLQIRDRIVELVDEGSLKPHDRLPTTRALADSIGVHRSTVVRAYDEIRALGYLESRPGSYSTIRRRARIPATTGIHDDRARRDLLDWSAMSTDQVRDAYLKELIPFRSTPPEHKIDFERLAADPRLTPADDLRRSLKSVLVRHGSEVLDYGEPAGWRPLREAISARLRSHGVAVSADEILVTSGAQQALDLILRFLTQPGDRVAVEAPTYGMAHALLRLHHLEPDEIPLLDDGMDLDVLEQVLERKRTKLVYTMPNFQNPTGITTNQAHRERLLSICEQYRVPIVEDGFEEEMKYFGKAVLPIKSIDTQGIVIYVGTFSKVVFPGLRVGWIAAPQEAIGLLTSIQRISCLGVNTLAQAATERFCTSGDFESYLRRIHRIYRRRLQAMLEGLERHMPPDVRWTRPVGGYTVWMTLPGQGKDEEVWCERFKSAGVLIAPGSQFFGAAREQTHFRLSISTVDEQQIDEGCRRIGELLERWQMG